MSPSICSPGAGAHIRALQGTSNCLQPDEGHRDICHCWRRAQERCPSLGLGSGRGFGSLGAVACRREASFLSSIYFGWTPRDIWESYICGSFLSHPSVSLPLVPAWCGPLVYHSIPLWVPGVSKLVLPSQWCCVGDGLSWVEENPVTNMAAFPLCTM